MIYDLRFKNRKRAFTLIELLVVVVVFGMILVTISTILINTVKVKNRTAIIQQLDATGSMTLDRLKYNLLNAVPGTINCPLPSGIGSSISFMDRNGTVDITVLNCDEVSQKIASGSATGGSEFVYNDSSTVTPSGCSGFVTCVSDAAGEVLSVGISFNLSAGVNSEIGISRAFQTSVTIRK